MTDQQDRQWITVADAAACLGTTVRAVMRLIKHGKLPAVYLSERQGYRIRPADLDTLATTQRKDEETQK